MNLTISLFLHFVSSYHIGSSDGATTEVYSLDSTVIGVNGNYSKTNESDHNVEIDATGRPGSENNCK